MTTAYCHKARRNPIATAAPSASPPKPKKEKLVALLRHKDGQELTKLTTALGWLPHSVRAAITRLRKNGLNVECYITNDGRSRYRLRPEAGR